MLKFRWSLRVAAVCIESVYHNWRLHIHDFVDKLT